MNEMVKKEQEIGGNDGEIKRDPSYLPSFLKLLPCARPAYCAGDCYCFWPSSQLN